MTSKRSKLVNIVLGALLWGVLAPFGAAQDSACTFTLPVETRWGSATLPAGDYSYVLESASGPAVVTVRGQSKSAMIMISGGTSSHPISDRSSLTLIRTGNKAVVRAFDLGHLGTTFFYRPPKGQGVLMAQKPELIQRVPVTLAAK